MPKPEDNFTQISAAIALRKTFPVRLAVLNFLNNLSSHGAYEETLRLDAELRASYKYLYRTCQKIRSSTESSASRFELRAVDFIMNPYFLSLHIPFFGPALQENAYAFSRKIVVDTSLKIWCSAFPTSSIIATQSSPNPDDLARLAACGSGFYRTTTMQATLLTAVEHRTQLLEEESIGPVPLRADLNSVLDDAKTWCLRCIEAGETNIKGYLLMCVVSAHIEALRRGLVKDEMPGFLVKAAESALETSLPMLEKMAAQDRETDGNVNGCYQIALNTPPEITEDWDFLMSDALLNPGLLDPTNWMLNDDIT